VIVLVIVLIVTNLVALGVLARFALRPAEHPAPSRSVAEAIDAARRPELSSSATRRVITIEILNPIELAGSRGRIVGIAGSLAPGITRRIVYDQAIKLVRRHLAEQKVVADVRLHTVRPGPQSPRTAPPVSRLPDLEPELPAFDPASPVDLHKRDDEPDSA
jgi:hypothetical protein